YSARSWELQRRKSVSPHDSVGANLIVQVKNNRVMRVLPRENEDVNECWISDKDRFSYEALNSDARLTKPMIRVDGQLREVEWNVALDYVAHGLNDIVKQHGPSALGLLASPHSTLEELVLLKKVAAGLGSKNIDFRLRRRDFSADGKLAGRPWLGMKLAEIADLDAALVIGSFLRKEQPLLAQRLRQAAKKYTKVSVVTTGGDDQLIKLFQNFSVSPSDLVLVVAAIVKAAAYAKGLPAISGFDGIEPCDKAKAIAQSLIDGDKRHIFLGNVAEQHPQAAVLHALAQELAKLTGAGFGFLGEAANSVGGYVVGALPTANGLNACEMLAQPRQAYVVLGADLDRDVHNGQLAIAALKQAALTVVLTPFKDGAMAECADALLPVTPFTETSGTFVNTEGRIQRFNGVVPPLGDARPGWKVLRVLGNVLGLSGFDFTSSEAVRDTVVPAGAEFVSGLDNGLKDVVPAMGERVAGLQRIGDVPIHFADPLARRAPALQLTRDAAAPSARMCAATLAEAGLADGANVVVRQGAGSASLLAKLDETVPAGCVRVAAAHETTAGLGDLFGAITVERA
ncbi:MAG: molybdopterin-dependent oxidoreductase, partial [Azospira sp.]|nr:molybdopterin-dependent oxidoreductase [Azospira sp.]